MKIGEIYELSKIVVSQKRFAITFIIHIKIVKLLYCYITKYLQ